MRLINRDFTLLWAGQAVSQTGDFVFDTTLTLWIGAQVLNGSASAPAAVAGLLITVAVATLVVAPLAGVFVDRWDYRRTMLGSDLIRGLLIGGVAVLAFLPAGTLPTTAVIAVVYLAVFVNAAVSQFFNPARFAILSDVVTSEDRAKAAGIGQSTQAIASILGPPLAAPLLVTAGVGWSLALNALSYLGSFLLVRAVRAAPSRDRERTGTPGVLTELMAGLRTAVGNHVVRVVLGVIALISVGIGALNTVNLFFVRDNLHADVKLYGTLDMALGIGLLAGSVLATPLGARIGYRRLFAGGLLMLGLLLAGYARMTEFWPALVLIAVCGLALAPLNAALAPLLIDAVPQQFLGRVFSVLNPVQQVANVIGMGLAGWLASTVLHDFHADLAGLRIGGIDSVLTVAALMVLAGGVFALLALRERPQQAVSEVGRVSQAEQSR